MITPVNIGRILWFTGDRASSKLALERIKALNLQGVRATIKPGNYTHPEFKRLQINESRPVTRIRLFSKWDEKLIYEELDKSLTKEEWESKRTYTPLELRLVETVDVYAINDRYLSVVCDAIENMPGVRRDKSKFIYEPGNMLMSVIKKSDGGVQERKMNNVPEHHFELNFIYPITQDGFNSGYPSTKRAIFEPELLKGVTNLINGLTWKGEKESGQQKKTEEKVSA